MIPNGAIRLLADDSVESSGGGRLLTSPKTLSHRFAHRPLTIIDASSQSSKMIFVPFTHRLLTLKRSRHITPTPRRHSPRRRCNGIHSKCLRLRTNEPLIGRAIQFIHHAVNEPQNTQLGDAAQPSKINTKNTEGNWKFMPPLIVCR